ncbi:hypothetical protein MYE70_10355 [Marinobacter alexandrii]|uniref:hypothetical protein n=1 Tax=Marinobacter alexandrii TaxID=2570351 RepID=UPI0020000593|nr:hypothetical protein [Marinobacter alexandrii]MCK2149467.1 hypothetical protein [Marinobacter alexandrii]
MHKGSHSALAWLLALAATIAFIATDKALIFIGMFICTALICGAIEKAEKEGGA